MIIVDYLKSRLKRNFSVFYLGPNEARLLYDFSVGSGALILVFLFLLFFLDTRLPWQLIPAPAALICLNALMGIYSRLRTASGVKKAVVLSFSLIITCAALIMLTGEAMASVLWGMLTGPSLILARLLLSLHNPKKKNLAVTVIKQRGPILVTGGAGYIGSTLVDLLLKNGHAVRVLDRLMYGRESLLDFENNANYKLIEGDVTDIGKLTTAMQDVSAVVHLAGLVGDPACAVDQNLTRQMNIISTRMVRELAQSMGVSRFVFASSCSVYGMSDKEVKECDPLNPVSLYAQTKIDSESELLASVPDDFFVTILRFATVFGHSRRPRFDLVANLFAAQAMIDGRITVIGPHQWRPFVHVRDLARAIYAVLKSRPVTIQSQVFNVGDKRLNMTILQVAETVKSIVEKYGKNAEIIIQDQDISDRRNYAVSFDKIEKFFGFQANTLMEDGIQEIVENFNRKKYNNYHEQIYSNVATTKKIVSEFYDPMQSMKLYAPLKIK